jgi:hypothetical protein
MSHLMTTQPGFRPCVARRKQYECGCVSKFIVENRHRNCPNCWSISDLALHRAFCLPNLTVVAEPSKCEKCEHGNGVGEAGSDQPTTIQSQPHPQNEATSRQERGNANSTPLETALCSAIVEVFLCGCASQVSLDRQLNCPDCQDICHTAKRRGLCRPLPAPIEMERICDKCMASIEQRATEPPRCLLATANSQNQLPEGRSGN